jgi:Tol biopolymer transport system component
MLSAGTKLGSYEILSQIGAGGMGEVYRARDTKLGRDVAIKVLPDNFAQDAERMARFQREAKVLASLDHPNIASIFGLEDSGNTRALVMQLAEGPTLADRIAQGPLPIDDALRIARQIADALEYAHEKGIIHRDLKPANIKVAPDDSVKILDFGLAKALESEAAFSDISTSPTLSRLATQAGILLGTAAYMSPEQAKGKHVDRRADIWAFGCVLYEMLTGRKAFHGDTVPETLGAIMRAEPDWSQLPAATPMRVRVLLQRCLQKDPKQRLQAIGDARISLEEVLSGTRDAFAAATPTLSRRKWLWLGWGATATLAVALAFALIGYVARAPHPAGAVVAQIALPPGANAALWGLSPGMPALSPDGTQLAFAARTDDGKQLLWVRPLNSSNARPLEETDGAGFPFWSPDGRSLGYFARGKLYRIDASGGPPVAVADATIGGGWGRDDTILFRSSIQTGSSISGVSASGGRARQVVKLGASLRQVAWPQLLPDGKHFLFYAISKNEDDSGTYAASLDGGEPKLILRGGSDGVYASPGYLLLVRDGTLTAQKFDASSLRLNGEAMPVAENVGVNGIIKRGIFSASDNGTLVYETATRETNEILWYDRSGKQIAETGVPGRWGSPSISPDGHKLAISFSEDPGVAKPDVWVYDLARGIKTRLTFAPAVSTSAFWSPDGRTVGFMSNREGKFHLYQKAADGTGSVTPLVAGEAAEFFGSWSADGRYFIFQRAKDPRKPEGPGRGDVWAMPLFGDRKPFPVVQNGQFNAISPALSPNGKWLAYVSDESGRWEVYIGPFLHGRGRWEVSAGGGNWPRWRGDGKEIFYRSPEDKIMSAEIEEQGASLSIGKVQALFQADPAPGTLGPGYDISPDAKKFVIVSANRQQAFPPLTVVLNWPSLLKK